MGGPAPLAFFATVSWFSGVAARIARAIHDREIILADHQIGGFDLEASPVEVCGNIAFTPAFMNESLIDFPD